MAYGGQNVAGATAALRVGPAQASTSASIGGVNVRGSVPPPVFQMLLVLVAIEVFILIGGRIAFKNHHGG